MSPRQVWSVLKSNLLLTVNEAPMFTVSKFCFPSSVTTCQLMFARESQGTAVKLTVTFIQPASYEYLTWEICAHLVVRITLFYLQLNYKRLKNAKCLQFPPTSCKKITNPWCLILPCRSVRMYDRRRSDSDGQRFLLAIKKYFSVRSCLVPVTCKLKIFPGVPHSYIVNNI